MRKVAALLASALMAVPSLGVPSTAEARPTGHRFCTLNSVRDNNDLADRLAESMRLDPSGKRRLRNCMANANQFLAAFRNTVSERTFDNVDALVRYLREDVEVARVGVNARFTTSCVRGRSTDATDVVMNCGNRSITAALPVLRDKTTGRLVMILECANPGLSPLDPPPCVYVILEVKEEGTLQMAQTAQAGAELTAAEEALCPSAIAGPVAGGSFTPSSYRLIDGRVEGECDFRHVEREFNTRVQRSTCQAAPVGFYSWRTHARVASDPRLRVFACVQLADGTWSMGQGAEPATYRLQPDRTRIAMIWFHRDTVPAAYRAESQYLRWPSDPDE